MLSQTAYPAIEAYAKFDLEELEAEVDKKWGLDPKLIKIDISEELDDREDRVVAIYHITGTYQIEDLEVELKYECIDDPNEDEYQFPTLYPQDLHDAYMHRYYMSMNQPHDAEAFRSEEIKASTAIMAADDDDPFADMGFDEPEGTEPDLAPQADDDSVEDTLDDMADTLDDMNDALDEVKEDDIDIEMENNIAEHYIAECEKCQGIFITSIEASDQEISCITGTCPLCDEECDQYIKWVIKEL